MLSRVIRGSIDIVHVHVVVLSISCRTGSIQTCGSMHLGCLVPVDGRFMKFLHLLTLQVEISPVPSGIDHKSLFLDVVSRNDNNQITSIYIYIYMVEKIHSNSPKT